MENEQVEFRVQKILASERSEAREIQKCLESEIKSLEGKLVECRLENESLLKQMSNYQQDILIIRQSKQKSEEELVLLTKELYQKLDDQAEFYEQEIRAVNDKNQTLLQELRDLKFEIETLTEKSNYFQSEHEQC